MPRQRRDSRFLVFWFPNFREPIGQISCRPPYYKSLLECNLSRQPFHHRNPPISNALQLLIENQLPICICILRSLVFGRGLKPYSISLFYFSSCLFLVFNIAIFPSRRLLPAVAASFPWRPRLQHRITENRARTRTAILGGEESFLTLALLN